MTDITRVDFAKAIAPKLKITPDQEMMPLVRALAEHDQRMHPADDEIDVLLDQEVRESEARHLRELIALGLTTKEQQQAYDLAMYTGMELERGLDYAWEENGALGAKRDGDLVRIDYDILPVFLRPAVHGGLIMMLGEQDPTFMDERTPIEKHAGNIEEVALEWLIEQMKERKVRYVMLESANIEPREGYLLAEVIEGSLPTL